MYDQHAPQIAVRFNREAMETARHDLGATDKRGRAIGSIVHLTPVSVRQFPNLRAAGEAGFLAYAQAQHLQPGAVAWALETTALRDGKYYGPSTGVRFFQTRDAAGAAVLQYLRGATKRAAKASA